MYIDWKTKKNVAKLICIECKLTDNPYPKSANFRATQVLELVHSEVCGPKQTATVGEKYYFLTFVDDFSRFTVLCLLRNKHEVFSKLKEYVATVANKFGRKVQAIHSDNEGEYIGRELRKGTHLTIPYSALEKTFFLKTCISYNSYT